MNVTYLCKTFARRNQGIPVAIPQSTEPFGQVGQGASNSTIGRNAETIAKKSAMKVNTFTEKRLVMFDKTLFQALKMSCIHVLAFVISWTPYTVMATWFVLI